jgi:predicted transposase YdaD
MCKAMEDMRAEARAEGRAEGRVVGRAEGSKENAISVARKMLKTERFSHEEIANFLAVQSRLINRWY